MPNHCIFLLPERTLHTLHSHVFALPRVPPPQDELAASKNCISLAARLAGMEQSVPYEAVDNSVEQEEWDEWE